MTKRIWKSVAVHFHICLAVYLLCLCGVGHALAGASEPALTYASSTPLHSYGIQGALLALVNAQPGAAQSSTGTSTSIVAGQSSTLLPDGRLLLIGGEQNGRPVSAAFIEDPVLKTVKPLPNGLHIARYCHTATLLPNGTVLVLGGIGMDGKVVETNEIFDPSTLQFAVIATQGLTPRAFHTATLLTDGRVLIAGGVTTSGQLTGKLEFWDYRTGAATQSSTLLQIPRGGDTATLEANGTVQYWGGVNSNGNTLNSGEVYNPATENIATQSSPLPPSTIEPPMLSASLPTDGAQNVALNAIMALRFSKALQVQSVDDKTVSLKGPNGAVPIEVVPAEGGILAFVTPEDSLLPATQYELSILDATDPSGNSVRDTVVRFTTISNNASGTQGAAAFPVAAPNPFDSPARKLPPLHAPKGVTAVSGQVLQLNGDPLPNMTLQIGKVSVRSDKTGRFLLKDVPSGHQVMWIVGTTANGNGQSYGIYEDGVNVVASQTTVLSYTIWMTPLDTADEVTVPSPTTAETVVSTPLLPGLELHIPAGLVIKDWYGNTVTKVGITLIPTAQPPFPLPVGVNVPTYFTIQPGGAYFEAPGQTSGWAAGAQLYYPNTTNLPPYSLFDFWNYDPTGKGWYVYGQGRVTADKEEIIPNPGVEIYGFTGAMVGMPPYPPNGPCCGNGPGGQGPGPGGDGDPVDLQTGLFVYTKTDLALSDVIPINVTRTYRQLDSNSHAFGLGTMSNYDIFVIGDGTNYSWMALVLANGGLVTYNNINGNNTYGGCELEETGTPGMYYGSEIYWNGTGWTLALRDGTTMLFPENSGNNSSDLKAALAGIVDRHGNTLSLSRDSNGNLLQVTSPNGRWIQYSYYPNSSLVSQVTDSIGRTVYYTYDTGGRLQTVKDANGGITTFGYDSNGNMTTIEDPQNIVYLTNHYNTNDMISEQDLADGSGYDIYKFNYVQNTGPGLYSGPASTSSSITNSQATVTDPRGNIRVVNFNPEGYITSETYGYGTPQAQTISYNRQPYSGLILSATDALNRTTAYTYDSAGDVTNSVAMSGTPEATATSFAYNSFGQLTSVTDALGRTTSLNYDNKGNLVNYTGTDGNTSSFTYNAIGQAVTVTDPLGNTTQLSYRGPDLNGVTDPLSRQVSMFTDSAGRVVQFKNELGANVQYALDPLNQVTSVTDPLGGVTSLGYDGDGNLTSVTDPKNTQTPTKFAYYNTDRLQTRTDPLGNAESYQYDGDGNLTQYTDRNGNITTYQYDSLNRLTFVGFGTQPGPTYQSTISYTWDAGNRLTQVVDSTAGTTTIGYDDFNRTTSLSSPQGSISYTYDAIGRRQTMTVSGQSEVDYTYDSGNRVTKITQGTSVVQIGYDADGRRISLTLPNGVVASYSYDVASELTGITYTNAGSVLGDLEYTYDSAGHLATTGGSLAHINLPPALAGASYNADNQLTQWGATAMSYDPDGNLLNDGLHAYSWNARGQLAAIDNGSTASFVYGPFGRRISKTVYGVSTGFLYDGPNVAQELSGSNPSANLLTGGLDEVFTRTDSSGVADFIRDGLGSTAALTDSTGAIQQTYTYDPFGATSTNGGSANSYQYIGREADATGLYYFRARYYDPAIDRFLSEDPAGFAGSGPNLYEYVDDDPTSLSDPLGLWDPLSPAHSNPPPGCSAPSCFYYYGNYGGPGWTGGQWQPWEKLGNPFSPGLPPGFAQPVDAQDAQYMQHDRCYSQARVLSGRKDQNAQTLATAKCDLQLSLNLANLTNPFSPSFKWQNINIFDITVNSALHQGVAMPLFFWRGVGKLIYASPGL